MLALSAVLSRGVRAVIDDMDQPENGLMGSHLYCTQDIVNLLLTGRATANVFDGVRYGFSYSDYYCNDSVVSSPLGFWG